VHDWAEKPFEVLKGRIDSELNLTMQNAKRDGVGALL
jgi:hypothetical protein